MDIPLNIRGGYENIKKMLGTVTAIFCASDHIAIGVLNYLKEVGIKVPQDISIIGFSNLVEARNMEPSLTTMDQKSHIIGEIACRMLLKLIRREDLEEKICFIEPELVIRNSTKGK